MLDNPIWGALVTHQAHFASGDERVKRYPADMAPFLATAGIGPAMNSAVTDTAPPGERLYMLGAEPSPPTGWEVEHRSSVSQMIYSGRLGPTVTAEAGAVLGKDEVPDMLELTSLAFPGFFRPRTIEMGTYFGIRQGGRLVAMAGERMCFDGYCEVSGICTHPDHRGQGYARLLISQVIGQILGRGLTPFLHVGSENAGARTAYEKTGFVVRADLSLLRIRRHGGVRDDSPPQLDGHSHR